jgi:acyl-CoA thioesterase-1
MLKIIAAFAAVFMLTQATSAQTITILALGDSLTAGYGLQPSDAFPVKLEQALKAK